MYSKLKNAMREAGLVISEGEELLVHELQVARDFLFFQGHNLGEEFHKFGETLEELITPAPKEEDAVVTTAEVPSVDAVGGTDATPEPVPTPTEAAPQAAPADVDTPVDTPTLDTTVAQPATPADAPKE